MGFFRFVFSLVSEQIIMADAKEPLQSVQTFGRKKNATAVAYCKRGKGLLKVNGRPLEEVEPKPCNTNYKNHFSCSERTDLLMLTLEFVSRVVVILPKSMLSVKPYPNRL